MKDNTIKWVWSGGGPIICIPESQAYKWGGALTRNTKNVDLSKVKQPADFMDPKMTHYGELCEKDNDFIIWLKIDDIPIICFGQDPSNTTWISISDTESVFVRFFCGYGDESVYKIEKYLDTLDWEKELELEIKEENWFLFDSAGTYKETLEDWYGNGENYQKLRLQTGKYAVFSTEYSLNDDESFDVYRFIIL